MERRRRLLDGLASTAAEPLAHRLDHLPLPRDHLQCLGDILAELRQPRAAAAGTGCRCRHDDPLARQMLGEGLTRRALARERSHGRGLGGRLLGGDLVLGCGRLQLFQLQLQLIEKARGALRALAEALALELLDLELQVRDQRPVGGQLGAGGSRLGLRREQGCLQCLDIVWERCGIGLHPRH